MRGNPALRYLAIGGLILGQVIPNTFTLFALPAIYRSQGVDLADIGILSIALFPFWFKWLWAPIVDRFGNRSVGLRKSWIIPCTLTGAAIYGLLTLVPPSSDTIYIVAALLVLKNFVMATQDIAVDAYIVEALERGEEAAGAAIAAIGTTIGGVIGGALLVGFYDVLGWEIVMVFAAAMLLLASSVAMILPERAPAVDVEVRKVGVVMVVQEIRAHLRSGASKAVLAMVFLAQFAIAFPFRIDGAFLVDKGLSLAEIGFLGGGATTIGAVAGNLLGGRLGRRFGLQALLSFGTVALVAIAVMYVFIAVTNISAWDYAILNLIGTLLGAPVYVALNAARYRWCSPARVGTDYTLQSSLTYLAQAIAAIAAGFLAAAVGWTVFYVIAGAFMVATFAFLALVFRRLTNAVDARDAQYISSAAPMRPAGADAILP
jgi:MFS family permease